MRSLLVCLLAACVCAADLPPITALVDSEGRVSITDAGGAILDLGLIAWGPSWAWTGTKWQVTAADGATAATGSGTLGGSKVPFTVALAARQAGERSLTLTWTFTPGADTALTMCCVGINPGQRFHGAGRGTVTDASGGRSIDVPFGRAGVGSAVTGLELADAAGGGLKIRLTQPRDIRSDGQARLVLAADKAAGGQACTAELTIELPAPVRFYPAPAALPDEPGIADWFPWHGAVEAGAMDMAGWLDAPAGAHGRVVRDGERLLVGGKPARFWGVNYSYAGGCAPAPELGERRAAFLAARGVNAVRLHKYADGPGWAGIQAAGSSTAFDPAGLERMDAFVAALKAKGIYVELSSDFMLKLGEAQRAQVPWMDELGKLQGKDGRVSVDHGGIYIAEELQDLQIAQLVALLTHVNPHTGLSYAADPAVLAVELYNEDSALFYGTMGRLQKIPTLRKRASEAFCAWLVQRYGDEAKLLAAWGPGALNSFKGEGFTGESLAQRSIVPAGNPWFYDPDQLAGSQAAKAERLRDTMLFWKERQDAFYARCTAALRKAGYQGEIVASNWQAGRAFSHLYNLASDRMVGLIDRHNYTGGAGSNLAHAGSGLLGTGMQQVADRPFMLSEWIHTFPCEWGAEGPAIIAAYGLGLQGWDASFMFQNGDNGGWRDHLGDEWDIPTPQIAGTFPAVARMVLRGDVAEAPVVHARNVCVDALRAGTLGFDDKVSQSGDVKEMDSATVSARALAAARLVIAFTDQQQDTRPFDLASYVKDGAIVSATGQLRWYEGDSPRSGCISIDTPGTKAVIGFAGGRSFGLGEATIAPASPFAAIYLTAADPDASIATGKRLLLVAMARSRNSGAKYLDGRMLVAGTAPLLVEPVTATITLKRSGATVKVLDHAGKPTGATVPVAGGTFTIDGALSKTPYYEIDCE